MISWNGIATYGALALGAPVGVAIANTLNPALIGVLVIALAAIGFYLARLIASVPLVHGERMSYASVFTRVLPHGLGLALGSAGFGSIATFVTLYYAARHWPNAALSLTVFGTLFIGARLLFANTIKTYGGFRVAIVSFAFECSGLLLLWLAPVPHIALVGAALTGFGFALIFRRSASRPSRSCRPRAAARRCPRTRCSSTCRSASQALAGYVAARSAIRRCSCSRRWRLPRASRCRWCCTSGRRESRSGATA